MVARTSGRAARGAAAAASRVRVRVRVRDRIRVRVRARARARASMLGDIEPGDTGEIQGRYRGDACEPSAHRPSGARACWRAGRGASSFPGWRPI